MNELIDVAHTFKTSSKPDMNWLDRVTGSLRTEYHANLCLAGMKTCKHVSVGWYMNIQLDCC